MAKNEMQTVMKAAIARMNQRSFYNGVANKLTKAAKLESIATKRMAKLTPTQIEANKGLLGDDIPKLADIVAKAMLETEAEAEVSESVEK
jgi:hypothetical protein